MSTAMEADEERQLLHEMMEELAQALLTWREKVDLLAESAQLDSERELLECYLPRGADQLVHVLRTCRSAVAQYATLSVDTITQRGNLPCDLCYGTGNNGDVRCYVCGGRGTK